jgi:hypothetical protein
MFVVVRHELSTGDILLTYQISITPLKANFAVASSRADLKELKL